MNQMMMQFEPLAFLCDDLDVRMSVPDPTKPGFDLQDLLERCSGQIYHVYNLLRLTRREVASVAVCGGITDGEAGKDFYAFDIYVFTGEGGYFLPVDEANALFSTAGLLQARSLFAGFWEGCLAGNNGPSTAN